MWEKINNFLKGQIVTSIIYIALGACLVFMPVSTVNVICKFVFGILLILVGLYHILIYVAEKLNSTIFDLFSGGVLMVLGIFLFMNPQIVVKLLPILLGTFILVDRNSKNVVQAPGSSFFWEALFSLHLVSHW